MRDLEYEERAAIMEYDGGLPRAEAERRARRIMAGLGDVPEQIELSLGQQEFRGRMREMWPDY